MRGQADSPFSPDDELGEKQIVADAGRNSDWNIPYEQLTSPTLVITGLQQCLWALDAFLRTLLVAASFSGLPPARRSHGLDVIDRL